MSRRHYENRYGVPKITGLKGGSKRSTFHMANGELCFQKDKTIPVAGAIAADDMMAGSVQIPTRFHGYFRVNLPGKINRFAGNKAR